MWPRPRVRVSPSPGYSILTVLNRAPRTGLFALALASIRVLIPQRRQPGRRGVAVLYGLGWAAFYGWYWALRGGDDPPQQPVREAT